MKKFVTRSVLLLAVALMFGLTLEVPIAAASFTADSNITVTGVTFGTATIDMLILSGSTSDSWEISGGVFTVSSPGENFKIGSADSSVQSITAYRSGSLVACAVNTTAGSSSMTLPTVGGLYTITPSTSNACATTSGAIAPGGGSSSSSAASTYQSYDQTTGVTSTEPPKAETPKVETTKPSTTPAKTTTPAAPAASTVKVLTKVVVSPQDAKYISTLAELKKVASWQVWKDTTTGRLYKIGAATASAAKTIRAKLDTALKGTAAVAKGVTVSPTDATYISTLAELKKVASWQVWKDTTTGRLYKIGAATAKAAKTIRAKLDTALKGVSSATPVSTAATLSQYLTYGSKGTDVSALQELLKKEGVYPEGIVNGSYGAATQKAVQRFQEKYKIAKKGQLGYGAVGAATRTKVNALLAK